MITLLCIGFTLFTLLVNGTPIADTSTTSNISDEPQNVEQRQSQLPGVTAPPFLIALLIALGGALVVGMALALTTYHLKVWRRQKRRLAARERRQKRQTLRHAEMQQSADVAVPDKALIRGWDSTTSCLSLDTCETRTISDASSYKQSGHASDASQELAKRVYELTMEEVERHHQEMPWKASFA